MKHDSKINLDDFEPQRHWLGFDMFVWAAKQPDWSIIPKPNSNFNYYDYEAIFSHQPKTNYQHKFKKC